MDFQTPLCLIICNIHEVLLPLPIVCRIPPMFSLCLAHALLPGFGPLSLFFSSHVMQISSNLLVSSLLVLFYYQFLSVLLHLIFFKNCVQDYISNGSILFICLLNVQASNPYNNIDHTYVLTALRLVIIDRWLSLIVSHLLKCLFMVYIFFFQFFPYILHLLLCSFPYLSLLCNHHYFLLIYIYLPP